MSEECSKCGNKNWSRPHYQSSILIPGIIAFDKSVIQDECLIYKCLNCGATKVTNTKENWDE